MVEGPGMLGGGGDGGMTGAGGGGGGDEHAARSASAARTMDRLLSMAKLPCDPRTTTSKF